jgi:hypothetical protein
MEGRIVQCINPLGRYGVQAGDFGVFIGMYSGSASMYFKKKYLRVSDEDYRVVPDTIVELGKMKTPELRKINYHVHGFGILMGYTTHYVLIDKNTSYYDKDQIRYAIPRIGIPHCCVEHLFKPFRIIKREERDV